MKRLKNLNQFLNLDKFVLDINKITAVYKPFILRFIFVSFVLNKSNPKLSLLKLYNYLRLFFSFLCRVYYEFAYILRGGGFEGNNYSTYILNLNFKRNRFFPQLKESYTQQIIFNNSLGIISKHFSLKKSYLRSKASYLLSAIYIRRLLTSLSMLYLRLEIVKIPKYIKEILNLITSDSNVFYNDPFEKNYVINEKSNSIKLNFSYIFFFNNKPYSVVKVKKKGRLKRKISKKVKILNNILD